jgi:spore germination protein GerM
MSKGFFSLFLVLIIAFSLSVIPQNDNLIDFGFIDNLLSQDEMPSEEDPADTFVPEYESTFNLDRTPGVDSYIYILSLSSNELEYAKNPIVDLNVYKLDEMIRSYTTEDVIISTEDMSEEGLSKLVMKLDLSQKNLELDPGLYTVKIKITDGNYSPEFQHELSFVEEYDYVGSSNTVPNGKTYLELYFADQEYLSLVPVSRLVDTSERRIRDTINNQFEGPNTASGLNTGSIGPWSYKAKLVDNNILELNYHSADVRQYAQGSTAGSFAVDSIVYSMTGIPYVDEVQFFVDEEIAGANYFHGMSLYEPKGRLEWPQIYLSYRSATDKVFLYPMSPYDIQVESVFGMLSGDTVILEQNQLSYLLTHTNVIFPLPRRALLNDITIESNLVTLDIDSASLSVYEDMTQNYQLMIDAIVYTYTSFDEIDKVQVLIDGEKESDFNGIDLSAPLLPKAYINLEPKN